MNMVTQYDELKYFIVDEDINNVVQLIKLNGNGWGEVKKKNGRRESINLDRLLSYEEIDKIKEKTDFFPTIDQEATIEQIQIKLGNPDGSIVTRTLKDEQAKKWQELIRRVCMFAEVNGCNPSWNSDLDWETKITHVKEEVRAK